MELAVFRSAMCMGSGFVVLSPTLWQRVQSSIDSYITIGTYRMTEQQASDELSLVSQVMIGVDEIIEQSLLEDWNIFLPDTEEDWLNDDLIDEDWGFNLATGIDFDVELTGTLDATSPYNYPPEVLTHFHEDSKVRYYPANTEGVYHLVTIKALKELQSFHLKLQELSGMLVGRL